jgi:transposase
MSDTVRTHVSKGAEAPARRIEVFTGAGRRRNWSAEEKAAIVAESYGSGDTVCGVALRHGLTHSQLFAWRRAARLAQAKGAPASPRFVPAVLEEPPPLAERKHRKRDTRSRRNSGRAPGIVEVAIDGVTVRVGRGAEAKTIAAVIRALKASS